MKLLNFMGASLGCQATKKVAAFGIFKLVCPILGFQNWEVGMGALFSLFLKGDSKTSPYAAEGSSEEGCFGICKLNSPSSGTLSSLHVPQQKVFMLPLHWEKWGRMRDPHTGKGRKTTHKYRLCHY